MRLDNKDREGTCKMYENQAQIDEIMQRLATQNPQMQLSGRARQRGQGLKGFFQFLRARAALVSLAVLFLAGTLIGTLLVTRASDQIRDALSIVLGGFLEKRQVQSFAAIAVSSFGSLFAALLVLFFCGFCTISQVIILLLPFFKGLGFGFAVGSIYAQMGTQAIGMVLALLFPVTFFGTLLLLFAAKTSLFMSLRLLRTTIAPGEQGERARMVRYCIRYLRYMLFGLAIALLDALLFFRLGVFLL